MERDSFIFYKSFYEAIKETDKETQNQLFNAICQKALYEKDIELTGTAKILYVLIKPQLEANSKRYADGKKGGRPKKETTGYKKEKTTGFENKKPNKNNNENVNENENVNNNDNVSDSCVDGLQEVVEFYNQNIGLITPHGLEVLEDYAKEMPVDLIIYAMQISVEANKKTIQYIKAILNNWQKAGIKTLIQAKEENQNRKKDNKKQISKGNYEQREYNNLDFLYKNMEE